jgi:hypothetical protein
MNGSDLFILVMPDLLKLVRSELIRGPNALGLRVENHYGSRWEMGQGVDLRVEDLRIRVLRDKLYHEVHFASVIDPIEWFDSSVVFQQLGRDAHGFSGTNAGQVVRELREFLEEDLSAVERVFSARTYPEVKGELVRLRTRAAQEFLRQLREGRNPTRSP